MRKTIGLFGGAFKPFHIGHYSAISKIANETDEVFLFVSNKNRIKKGEFPLLWNNMEKVWQNYLEKSLPNNVNVRYVGNPVRAIYEFLGEAEQNLDDHNTYIIYADEKDLNARFSVEKLNKYFPRLYSESQIRNSDSISEYRNLASGTAMRKFLQNDDLESFTSLLPPPIQRYGKEIWDILKEID